MLLVVGHLDAEIMNGGFSQLFYSKGAAQVSAMRDALAEMDCEPAAELVAREIANFRRTTPQGDGAPSRSDDAEFHDPALFAGQRNRGIRRPSRRDDGLHSRLYAHAQAIFEIRQVSNNAA